MFDPLHPYAKGLMGSIIVPEEGLRGCQTGGHSRGAAQPEKSAEGLPVCRTLQVCPAGMQGDPVAHYEMQMAAGRTAASYRKIN